MKRNVLWAALAATTLVAPVPPAQAESALLISSGPDRVIVEVLVHGEHVSEVRSGTFTHVVENEKLDFDYLQYEETDVTIGGLNQNIEAVSGFGE